MLKRRLQFSLAELLVVALAFGVLMVRFSFAFRDVEDKGKVALFMGWALSMFVLWSLVAAHLFRSRGRWVAVTILFLIFAALAGVVRI